MVDWKIFNLKFLSNKLADKCNDRIKESLTYRGIVANIVNQCHELVIWAIKYSRWLSKDLC
jgi:hypothetical protein